jgi:hypothetical protein
MLRQFEIAQSLKLRPYNAIAFSAPIAVFVSVFLIYPLGQSGWFFAPSFGVAAIFRFILFFQGFHFSKVTFYSFFQEKKIDRKSGEIMGFVFNSSNILLKKFWNFFKNSFLIEILTDTRTYLSSKSADNPSDSTLNKRAKNIESNNSNSSNESGNSNSPTAPSELKNKEGKVYKRSEETRLKISRALRGRPTNAGSYWKGRGGPSHPLYKHGSKTRDYEPAKYKGWILGVKKKSNFRCFITGETIHSKLACHHLRSWDYEPGRYDVSNGILISKEIHIRFHNEYGRGNNYPEQFERFLIENQYTIKYNITSFPWKDKNREPSLSIEETIIKNQTFRETKFKEFQEICTKRKHTIIDGEYDNVKSVFTIKCEIHNELFKSTAHNYKRSAHGLPCCGKQAVKDWASQASRDNKGKFISDSS